MAETTLFLCIDADVAKTEPSQYLGSEKHPESLMDSSAQWGLCLWTLFDHLQLTSLLPALVLYLTIFYRSLSNHKSHFTFLRCASSPLLLTNVHEIP